ncbi:MAG: LytR family transcriptional regulator [Ruminococcaceae bacterium]|nr:LytR family transcriptional regulator [Oscillospiraceae bacterium]
MKSDRKKKWSAKRIILTAILVLLLAVLAAAAVLILSLVVRYQQNSYTYQPPVERESEYIMPAYPDVVIDTEGKWQEGVDETEAETDVETEVETETAAPETEPAETETEAPETETAFETVEISYDPPETIASVVNPTPSAPVNVPEPNRDASFANSPNAVSVYGKTPIYKVTQKDPDVKNILVMGTDTRDVTMDRGRSDTMIIVSYNAKTGSVKLTSLLRDSLVPIEGHGWNRINTAYFFGGVGLAINTVNQLYGMDIQEFVVIDLNGANNFIDYIGGVDVYLTKEEAELYSLYTGKTIAPGMNHLDSNLAMTHMRNRTIGNDFGRTQRQRDTIMAMIQQILTNKTAAEIYDIVDYSFSLIKTNISATDLVGLATSVVGNASKLTVESQNVPYTDAYQFGWYNGMAIISFDIGEAAARINEFIYN